MAVEFEDKIDLEDRKVKEVTESNKSRSKNLVVDLTREKVCRCGNRFPVEYNSQGNITTRFLCDGCRSKKHYIHKKDILEKIKGVPRCIDCTALEGLEWGSVLRLDDSGRCPSCADWYKKDILRELRLAKLKKGRVPELRFRV